MRTKLRSKVTLLFMTCALLLAVSAVAAIADELRSSHNTFSATVRNLALQSGGATDTVSVRLNQENNDSDTQCNVDTGETLTIKAVSDNTSAATVKWAANNSDTIAFVGCQGNDAQNLTVTSGSAGVANITFSIVTNNTGAGTYDLTSRAPFTVTVAPPPNTATQVEVTGVADGASYEKGSVPPAGCTVVDAEDSNESASPVKVLPSLLDSYGLGLETVECSYTDGGNLTTTVRATYSIVDTTAPVIAEHDPVTEEATSANGAVVNYTPPTANDAVYGPVDVECTPPSGEQFPLGTTEVTCTATDAAGNTANGSFNVTVEDTTAPVIASHDDVPATATSANGATVTYTSPGTTDAVDGPGTANCTPASGTTFAVGSTTVTCNATDAAGNNATPTTFKVNVSYAWSNFLQPINVTGNQSIFKLGSTVPLKFQLTGASSGITNGTFYLKYAYTGTGDNNGEMEAVATTTGTTGTMFRYSEGQYIYNWSTKGVVTKPGNYELRVYTDSEGENLLGKVSIELKK